jgi:Fe-S-cluster containining protein
MDPDSPPETVTARGVLSLSGVRVNVEITVPAGPVGLGEVLPTFRSLAGMIVDLAERTEVAEGRKVSCRKGCGACCRQLVPIAEVEARQIQALVEGMPEPRRSEVRERFAEASRRIEQAGLRAGMLDPRRFTLEQARTVGLDYFRLGIACPFLEDESCSIHEVRPIACREYLVTTPAANCSSPSFESVRCVPLPGEASRALRSVGVGGAYPPWVPLSLALEWAEDHPDDLPARPGPEWVGEFMKHLTGQAVPGPPGMGP